jgi:hypothetical protein
MTIDPSTIKFSQVRAALELAAMSGTLPPGALDGIRAAITSDEKMLAEALTEQAAASSEETVTAIDKWITAERNLRDALTAFREGRIDKDSALGVFDASLQALGAAISFIRGGG